MVRIFDACLCTCNKGATGVCPGTQYCTNVEDFEFGCKQVTSGNIFPKSQDGANKYTKSGSWMTGDAVLMNQNTFHRGWKHDMQNGPDRGMTSVNLFHFSSDLKEKIRIISVFAAHV